MSGQVSERPLRAYRRITIPFAIITIVLFGSSLYIALAPYLVFHSMDVYRYAGYHQTAPIVAGVSLVPADVWVASTAGVWGYRKLWSRPPWARVTIVGSAMLLVTLGAAGFLYVLFLFIYLSTVNWLVF